jgi:molecular chaperone GrpE (heat shock protein)
LNDYEEAQQTWLGGFETAKLEENRRIQAELDRLTSQYNSRIQSNLDEVARAQDDLRNWTKQKQQEVQRITEAATYCVPQNGAAAPGNNLASVLERASVTRR